MINKLKKFYRYLKYHSYIKRWIVVAAWFSIFLFLVSGALFGKRISNIANTPINQAVNFENNGNSGTGNTAMKLISKAYDPRKKRMILQLKTTGNNDVTQQLISKYVEFNIKSLSDTDAEVSVIPVTDNDYIVDVQNLKPNFKALQVSVTNDTPITGSTNKSQGTAKFVVNEDNKLNGKVSDKSDKDLANEVVKQQIKSVKKDIESKHKKISLAQTTIDADKERQKTLQENEKYEVDSQKKKTQDNLDSLNNDISQNQQIISENKHGIKVGRKKIKLLEKKQEAIKDGSFKMPVKQHIGKIQQAKH
ncbi:hypothetical protein [Fructilactobacillus cliffordii]|uniref:Uncharacterized protein n=1 Tax=Fructilactobacillus cliffordii TaxID=2940299 RepID=A0A9Q9E3X7_9LACO|nr:hypothetical protein [Fructilactobacillus cliffordii]USS89978.1 hypothetical protein M3M40_07260 [Fructilactobacillus cliffordii]